MSMPTPNRSMVDATECQQAMQSIDEYLANHIPDKESIQDFVSQISDICMVNAWETWESESEQSLGHIGNVQSGLVGGTAICDSDGCPKMNSVIETRKISGQCRCSRPEQERQERRRSQNREAQQRFRVRMMMSWAASANMLP